MKLIHSRSGFGIIEVLIAFGLVGVLTSVMVSLFSHIQKQQRQTNVASTLTSMRENIIKILSDGRAWDNTIGDAANTNVECLNLRNGTCTTTSPGADPNPLVNAFFDAAPFLPLPILRQAGDAPGAIYINSTLPNSGFRNDGSPCDTFEINPALGNDSCPIRWEIVLQYTCAAGSPCIDPTVRVIAYVYYRPSPASGLAVTINENRFIIVLTRGARGENKSEPFEAAQQSSIQNTGGGPCNPGGWSQVQLNSLNLNEGGNASLVGGNVDVEPGTYSCSAQTSCFSCGTLRLRVFVSGTQKAISSGQLSPQWTLTYDSVPYFTFVANGPSIIQLEHFCEQATPLFPDYGKGMVLPPYGGIPTKFSSINCTRIF
jgi:type II secretory pathway pseudopilin PulG